MPEAFSVLGGCASTDGLLTFDATEWGSGLFGVCCGDRRVVADCGTSSADIWELVA
jgi:hypothetical protein